MVFMIYFTGRFSIGGRLPTCPTIYTRGSPWTSTSSLSTPARIGSGRRLVQFAHSQKRAVLELSTPDTTPIMRGLHVLDASPAPSIESIIMDHVMVSIVANT